MFDLPQPDAATAHAGEPPPGARAGGTSFEIG
jgi:hypothetical protein